MTTLTLIGYKRNSKDYFRGEVHERKDSEHHIVHCEVEAASLIVATWADWLTEPRASWEADYEVTLLVNGAPPTEEHAALVAEIEERRDYVAQTIRAKQAMERAERERERAARAAEAERERELTQLRRLAEKHGIGIGPHPTLGDKS